MLIVENWILEKNLVWVQAQGGHSRSFLKILLSLFLSSDFLIETPLAQRNDVIVHDSRFTVRSFQQQFIKLF